MKLEEKRIFISSLPQNITQTDLEQKFSEYGTVVSVEIKERKNCGVNQTPQFAYINLSIAKNDLFNCLEEFANKKWKGNWLNIQEAKESFMDRLKRERAEKDQSTKSEVSTSSSHLEPAYSFVNHIVSKPTKVYHSSSSDEEDIIKQDVFVNGSETHHIDDDNRAKASFLPSSKKATIVNDSSLEAVRSNKKGPVSEAEQKRIQSVIRMRRDYQQQKQVLRNALSNIDSAPKNKIIFDEEDEIDTPPAKKTKIDKELPKVKENKKALFDDEEDEGENLNYSFEIKEQFEGKKGQKLMQLQSRFKNDKRFTMDERFLEEEEGKVDDGEVAAQDNDMTLDEEREKQFEILEQVLGKKIRHKSTEEDGKHNRQNVKMMLRFDPSQPQHSKFEIKEDKKKKRKEVVNKPETKTAEETPKPEVSKETFYKIATNLKDALHEKSEEFSLANLFSKNIDTVRADEPDTTAEKPNKSYQYEPNPFHYDSSADEDDTNPQKDYKPAETNVHVNRVGPAKLWTESFFFKHDDYRLQEGFDFIKRLEVDDQSDFPKLRRNLHEIVKAKVRNNQRKNRPFRRKLGGKKRLRVKRAMKR